MRRKRSARGPRLAYQGNVEVGGDGTLIGVRGGNQGVFVASEKKVTLHPRQRGDETRYPSSVLLSEGLGPGGGFEGLAT